MLSLVCYSSSDEEDKPKQPSPNTKPKTDEPPTKRIRLPNKIKDLELGRSKDDQLEYDFVANCHHNGRVRSFAHERGNWATYIYIHFHENDEIAELQRQISEHIATDRQDVVLHPTDQLHVSLTRTVVLQHHWIESFVETIRESVPKTKRFPIHMDGLRVYCNDDRTRTFVALSVAAEDCSPMKHIVDALDRCLDEFKLPPFYEESSFHVSILWCLGDQREFLLSQCKALQHLLEQCIAQSAAEDEDGAFDQLVDRIECKIGNKFYSFSLT